MILDEDVKMLKHSVTMRQLAEYHGIKVSRDGFCICPFHAEKTGSMKIYPRSKGWHCFGACQEGGDIIAFEMKYSGLEFEDACKTIAAMFGIALHDTTNLDPEKKADIRKKYKQVQEAQERQEEHTRHLKELLAEASKALRFWETLAKASTPLSTLQAQAFNEIPKIQGIYDHLFDELYGKKDKAWKTT